MHAILVKYIYIYLGGRNLGGSTLYLLRDDSFTAVAAPVAKSNTPRAGLLTVPISPQVRPLKNPERPSLATPS